MTKWNADEWALEAARKAEVIAYGVTRGVVKIAEQALIDTTRQEIYHIAAESLQDALDTFYHSVYEAVQKAALKFYASSGGEE